MRGKKAALRRRGPRPSLSGEQIVAKAIELADRDGLGGLSMRRLADELAITAMSLYGYVPGKAELLDVMADRAYGEITPRGDPTAPWQTRLAALAHQHWGAQIAADAAGYGDGMCCCAAMEIWTAA
jgi:AcrR family transcriptional regulator